MTAISFVFKDSWATHNGIYRGNDRDSTTFEIDFWSDYMWGYEVEAGACDFAGNVMKKTAGGGLTYILGKLVAGFLSFFLEPALAGAVFGFFLGFLAGLFEDLSIFLQIGDMFNAISQFPQMIGNLISNPGIIVSMILDMVSAHLMRCNIVNPYLTQDTYGKDASWWGQRVVKKFWGESDPEADGMGSAIVFSVACTVSSVIGYLVQQFIVGMLVTGSLDLFLRFPPRPFEAGRQRLDRLVDTHPQPPAAALGSGGLHLHHC